MDAHAELRDLVRQLKDELVWAGRTGIEVTDQPAPPPPAAPQQEPVPARSPATASQGPSASPRPSSSGAPAARPELRVIREELGDCTRCKLHRLGRRQIVFGVGNPDADLMFVGEGPGADEDRQGEPFVGAAGQLLNKIIGAMGLQRSEVYIANIVKCRPPRNRDPEPDEVETCLPFVEAQIASVRPRVLVTLGRPATHSLLRTKAPITRIRGNWQEFQGVPVMPTFHPAYLLRNPAGKRPVWQDMQAVVARLGRQLPEKNR